jgi:DNA modification methylase
VGIPVVDLGCNGVDVTVHLGDCLAYLRSLPDDSVDSVVVDPPYGLGKPPEARDVMRAWLADEQVAVSGGGFMGKSWDSFVPPPMVWAEVLRVVKPGGHMVCFSGQRTIHWMGLALAVAGWEAIDLIGWAFWNGFPKSASLSKAFDRAAGAEREVLGLRHPKGVECPSMGYGGAAAVPMYTTAPATDLARLWDGWGTAVKPAIEPAILARKPLSERTIAANVERWGTGALNVDGCRFAQGDPMWPGPQEGDGGTHCTNRDSTGACMGHQNAGQSTSGETFHGPDTAPAGRFPANLLYCPKVSTRERERGCDALPLRSAGEMVGRVEGSAGTENPRAGAGRKGAGRRNHHCTLKPVALLRYLVRLVTPPGGTVLDPFMGAGSCGIAASLEGFGYQGAEIDPDYHAIAQARVAHARAHPEEWVDTTYGGKASKRPKKQPMLFGDTQ